MTAVELAPGVHWLAECFEEDRGHLHVACYLIEAPAGPLLIDTGSYVHRGSLLEKIEAVTGGEAPAAIVMTHFDLPHSGNLRAFQRRWPDVELIVGSPRPAVHGYPDAESRFRKPGPFEAAGRTLEFVRPPLADVVSTSWIVDRASGTMFTADGFGNFHAPDACDVVPVTPADRPADDDIVAYHAETLRWLEFVDRDLLVGHLGRLFETWPVERLAPTHGNPVPAGNVDEHVAVIASAV